MKPGERPIIFSGPMIRALQDGTKTQTRRVVKLPPTLKLKRGWRPARYNLEPWWTFWGPLGTKLALCAALPMFKCVYGDVGTTLWVRETHYLPVVFRTVWYRADGDMELKWRPSILMPRAYARILLRVTALRAERLQAITEADARAEGVANRAEYLKLWDAINGKKHPWSQNPLVWVITFEKL